MPDDPVAPLVADFARYRADETISLADLDTADTDDTDREDARPRARRPDRADRRPAGAPVRRGVSAPC